MAEVVVFTPSVIGKLAALGAIELVMVAVMCLAAPFKRTATFAVSGRCCWHNAPRVDGV